MNRKMLSIIIILSMLICLFSAGTGLAFVLPSPERAMRLSQERAEFNQIGDIKTLLLYIGGDSFWRAQYELEWVSSDDTVVEVLNDSSVSIPYTNLGVKEYVDIVAVGEGEATITAKVHIWNKGDSIATSSNSNAVELEDEEFYEFDCRVLVDTSASGVVIVSQDIVISNKRDLYQIEYLNFTEVPDSELVFSSDNDDVVSTFGMETIWGNHNGEAYITVTTPDNEYSDTCRVVVAFPEWNGLYYEVQEDNTIAIIGYDGLGTELIIPDEIEGQPVTNISMYAFAQEPQLESVIVGDNVEHIEERAFWRCKSLKRVKLGMSVKSIKKYGFSSCSELEEINFPDSLEFLGYWCFSGSTALETFVFSKNLQQILFYPTGGLTGSVKIVNLSEFEFTSTELKWFSDAYTEASGNIWYSQPIGGEILTELRPSETAYRQYPISYHTKTNDIGGNPERYGIESNLVLNPIPDQLIDNVVYQFDGWYLDADYTQKITEIDKKSREHVVLYAKQNATESTISTGNTSSSSSDDSGSSNNNQQYRYIAKVNPAPIQTEGPAVRQGSWHKQGSNWQYTDSNGQIVKNKWVYDQEKWYLMDSDGVMATGWVNVDAQWYLLAQEGSMITGWNHVNGKWYYMKESGAMTTGWIELNQKYYYLDASGALLTNRVTPDGYWVNKNGEWVK